MNIAQFVLVGLLPAAGSGEAPESSPASFRVSPAYQDAAPAETFPQWSGSVNVAASITAGNTENLSAAAAIEAVRRGEDNRLTLKAYWNFAQQTTTDPVTLMDDSQVTERNTGASAKYDIFANEKLYYYGLAAAQKDDLANLDLRYYAGAGAGYQFKETDDLSFSGEVGLNYTDENFVEPPPPLPSDDDSFVSLRLATTLGWQMTETARFEQTAEAFPAIDDFSDVFAKVDSKVRVNLTKSMFAQLQHVMDFDHSPATGANQTDHRILIGVGWSF